LPAPAYLNNGFVPSAVVKKPVFWKIARRWSIRWKAAMAALALVVAEQCITLQ